MITEIVLSVLEKMVNTYLQLDPNVIHSLGQHIGKCLSLEITGAPDPLYMTVTSEGLHLSKQAPMDISATLKGSLFTLFQLHTKPDQPPIGNSDVSISGDMHFAKNLRKILSSINIDWEEQLSHWIGDSAAHHTCETMLNAKQRLHKTKQHFTEDVTDFLQHEKKITPTRVQANNFYNQIDELRDDTERLSLRITQLDRKINQTS